MKASDIAVLVGGVDLSSMDNCYWVTKFVVHPDWIERPVGMTPDIALIKLDRPILFAHLGPKLVN